MKNRILANLNTNNTLTFVNDIPELYQGSSSWYYLDIAPVSGFGGFDELPSDCFLYISFRRSDGKTTSLLPLTTQDRKIWSIYLNSDWYFYTPGQLTFTIKVNRVELDVVEYGVCGQCQQTLDKEYVLSTSHASLYINPTPDFNKPAPLTPSAYDIINNSINTINNEIDELQAINPVINVEGNIDATLENGEGNAYVKVQYKDNNEELITIKLPDELATESKVVEYVDEGFESNNPIVDIQSGNENLNFYYRKYNGEEETINIKLPSDLITEEELTTELDSVVKYSELELDDNISPVLVVSVATAISTISNIDNEKETNALYVLQNAEEPNLYYTQDIVSYVEQVERNPNVITAGSPFEAIYVDDSILDATFSTSYLGTGSNMTIGTFTWNGSSATTQNLAVNITPEGKIQTLRIGWGYNLISGGALANQTIIMKNYNSLYEDSTSATLTLIPGYEGLFNELQPYLYKGNIVTERAYTQNTYELVNKEILSTVATTGDYNDLINTPITGLVKNKTTTNIGTIPSGSYRLGTTTPTAYCIAYNNGINQTTITIFYGGENCYVPLYTFNDATQTYDVNFNDYLYIKEYNESYYLCRSSNNIDWLYCYKIV